MDKRKQTCHRQRRHTKPPLVSPDEPQRRHLLNHDELRPQPKFVGRDENDHKEKAPPTEHPEEARRESTVRTKWPHTPSSRMNTVRHAPVFVFFRQGVRTSRGRQHEERRRQDGVWTAVLPGSFRRKSPHSHDQLLYICYKGREGGPGVW